VSLVPAACYSAAVSDTGEDPAGLPPEAAGVLDLLGLLAYASLTAFFRLSDDAALAIALSDKTALAEMAVAQFGHFQLLRARIEELNGDPGVVMQPFVRRSTPSTPGRRLQIGSKAWSRPMSVTVSRPTSTGPWLSC